MKEGLLKLLISIPFWIIEIFLGNIEWGIITTILAELNLLLIAGAIVIPIIMFILFFIIIGIYLA